MLAMMTSLGSPLPVTFIICPSQYTYSFRLISPSYLKRVDIVRFTYEYN